MLARMLILMCHCTGMVNILQLLSPPTYICFPYADMIRDVYLTRHCTISITTHVASFLLLFISLTGSIRDCNSLVEQEGIKKSFSEWFTCIGHSYLRFLTLMFINSLKQLYNT